MAWSGYVPNAENQSDQVKLVIKVLTLLVPGILSVGAIGLMFQYPLTEEVHIEIKQVQYNTIVAQDTYLFRLWK